MNALRRLGLWFFILLLSFLLMAAVWTSVITLTLGKRGTIKNWLNDSQAYTRVVDILLQKVNDSAAKDSAKSGGKDNSDSLPLDKPEVKAVVQKAFSPEFLKSNTEKVLDGTYNWLDGTATVPDFKLDLTSAKTQLATGLGQYVTSHLASLPVCTSAVNTDDFDALSATCRPKGLDPTAEGKKLTNNLLTSKEFLPNPVVTADTLKVDKNLFNGDKNGGDQQNTGQPGNGQPAGSQPSKVTKPEDSISLFQQEKIKKIPRYYQLGHVVPILLGVMALLCMIAILFLAPSKLQGVTRIGISLLASGIILLGTVFLIGFAQTKLKANIGADQTAATQQLLKNMMDEVFGDVKSILMGFGAGFSIAGLASIIGGTVLHKRAGHTSDHPRHDEPEPAHAEAHTDKTESLVAEHPEKDHDETDGSKHHKKD